MKDYIVAVVGLLGVVVGAVTSSIGDYVLDEGADKREIQLASYKAYVDAQQGNEIVKSQRNIAIYGQLEIAQKVAALISIERGQTACRGSAWKPTVDLNRAIRNAFYPDDKGLSDTEFALLLMGCVPPKTITE